MKADQHSGVMTGGEGAAEFGFLQQPVHNISCHDINKNKLKTNQNTYWIMLSHMHRWHWHT